jgi:hypothetical protein
MEGEKRETPTKDCLEERDNEHTRQFHARLRSTDGATDDGRTRRLRSDSRHTSYRHFAASTATSYTQLPSNLGTERVENSVPGL